MKFNLYPCILLIGVCSCNQDSKKEEDHDHSSASAETPGKILEKEVKAATAVSPEFIQLANQVEIIPNILDTTKITGVLTHEGKFGPFLFGENIRSFFIELKPGMFLSEHPHPTESMVYTVRGRWVLCSEGKRQVLEAGSLFHFGSNMPTGWEAPFSEGAFLLVLKSKTEGEAYEPYMKGLVEMKATLNEERKNGEPFYFSELKPDHPAVLFARSVNPDFDKVMGRKGER